MTADGNRRGRTRWFRVDQNANVLAGHPHVLCARVAQPGAFPMLDILMLALGLGFFALAIGYTYACERL